MSKLIHAIAIGAVLLSPSLASARMGSVGVSTHVGNVGVIRADAKPPRIHSDVNMLKCQQYPRGNGQGGVIYVTVCN